MSATPLAQPQNRRLLRRVAAAALVLAAATPVTVAYAASPSADVSPTAVAPGAASA
ncbi:hypothetical protein AB0D97_36105 [Streptomyces roseus]|uniref:hypothetical protein n=1 Tax=Streptomyces roseus TaxID=66430 RepID=UPI0033DB35E4